MILLLILIEPSLVMIIFPPIKILRCFKEHSIISENISKSEILEIRIYAYKNLNELRSN